MTRQTGTNTEIVDGKVGTTVFAVTLGGAIAGVMEARPEVRERVDSPDGSRQIDDIWSGEDARSIQRSVSRAIRERRSQDLQLHERKQEVLIVPQGPDRALLIARDFSEQQASLNRIKRLALTDEATGLPNRESLLTELQAIADVQRLKEGRAALLCIHVGQLDDAGWSLSAAQQDEVLRTLALRIVQHLRGTNDSEENDYERYSVAARVDFRQFGVVLPAIETGEDAEAVAERLITRLGEAIAIGARTVRVQPGIGVALFPQDGTDPESLYENASAAMNEARNEQEASIKFHSGTMRLRSLQRQDLEIGLRSALDNEEYSVNYLPIVRASDGTPVTLEALLRWPDALQGSQPTRKIVRIAERTGLIVPIGDWVIRRACRQLKTWHAAGANNVRLAVNLSTQEFVSDRIANRIDGILRDEQVDAAYVDVEVKEHLLLRETMTRYATCRDLKALGVRIVVDDFGTGSCSLANLSHSPIDALKIDNSIVGNIETSERDRAACLAATAMARALGIDVIAEGVETQGQAELLREAGCDYLQGFYFTRPLGEAESIDYLVGASARPVSAGPRP